MKKVCILLAATFALTSFTLKEPIKYSLPETGSPKFVLKTAEDKAFLLDYFQKTSDNLLKNLNGLSEAQLQFKPAPDRWSVGQCVEHIILTEEMLFGMTAKLMQKAGNPERKEEIKVNEQDLIKGIIDRSQKVQAPKELQPKGSYSSATAAVEAFKAQRDIVIEYIEKSSVKALRDHVTDSPFGPVDAYQSLLFIAGHCARHTVQIEEVKADSGFPEAVNTPVSQAARI